MEDCLTIETVKEEFVDCGFEEVHQEAHQLCTACLCATRNTHMPNDNTLKQYFINILTEIQLERDIPVLQSPRLCWECVAHLKRSVRFREQVQASYRLLQPKLLKCDKENQEDFTGDTSMFRPAGRLTSTFAFSIDISPQDDDTQVTADEDDDDKAAAEEYLGNNIKTFPSTCQAEDLDAQLEETDAHTHIHIPNSTGIESTRDCVVVLCSDEQCSECPNSLRLLKHNNMQTHSAVKANLLRNKNMLNVEKHRLKQFKNVPALNINKRTDASEKPFQCEVCSKSFNVFSHLNQHKRIHTGEKPFQCVVCRKSFSRRAYLKSHIRSHTGERPFQCDVCSKSFSVSCNLNKHKRIHTGEKPFQCEVCWRSFSQRTALISHLRSHTGEKPFQCEVCNKPFSHKCDLVVHKRTHTGEKPFQCDVCNKSFSHRSHLIVHIRSHTARNRFNVR